MIVDPFIGALINEGRYTLVASELYDMSACSLITKYLKTIDKTGTKVISIVGGEASGKSTFAKNLVKLLKNADTISTDDFLLGSRAYRREFFEGRFPLKKYNFELLKEKIESIKELKPSEFESVPTYDQEDGVAIKIKDYDKTNGEIISIEKDDYKRRIPKVEYLLIEGDFQPIEFPDFKIYFHVPDETRLQNRITRDPKKRSAPTISQITENFQSRQKLQYTPYTLPNASQSDMLVIVDTKFIEHPLRYVYSIYISTKPGKKAK